MEKSAGKVFRGSSPDCACGRHIGTQCIQNDTRWSRDPSVGKQIVSKKGLYRAHVCIKYPKHHETIV